MQTKVTLILLFGFAVLQCTPAPVEQGIHHELAGKYPQLQANKNNLLAHDHDYMLQLRIKRSPFNLHDADDLEASYVNPQKVSRARSHGYNGPGYSGPGYNGPGETVVVNVPNDDYNRYGNNGRPDQVIVNVPDDNYNNNGRPDQVIVNMHDANNQGYGRRYYRSVHHGTYNYK